MYKNASEPKDKHVSESTNVFDAHRKLNGENRELQRANDALERENKKYQEFIRANGIWDLFFESDYYCEEMSDIRAIQRKGDVLDALYERAATLDTLLKDQTSAAFTLHQDNEDLVSINRDLAETIEEIKEAQNAKEEGTQHDEIQSASGTELFSEPLGEEFEPKNTCSSYVSMVSEINQKLNQQNEALRKTNEALVQKSKKYQEFIRVTGFDEFYSWFDYGEEVSDLEAIQIKDDEADAMYEQINVLVSCLENYDRASSELQADNEDLVSRHQELTDTIKAMKKARD